MKIKTEEGTILELKDGSYVSEDAEIEITLDEAEEQILAGKVEIVAEEEVTEEVTETVTEAKKSKKEEAEEDDEDEDEDEADKAEEEEEAEDDEDEDEADESKKSKTKKNEEVELSFASLDITSDVNEMFGDNEFSDEFKVKASVIYEAAVKSTIKSHAEKIEESMETKLEESVREGLDEISTNLNSYLDYISEEWMKANELAIESGIKTEITENFMNGLKGLFTESYVDLPEDKRDLVAEQAVKITELETQLDEELNRKIAMKAELHEANMAAVFDKISEDLTETDKAKLKSLAEDLTFESNEDYQNKLNILKENYFKTDVQDTSETPAVESTTDPIVSDSMSTYINAIANMNDK